MERLSGFSGREIMRVAERNGWVHRRTSGDHFVFDKANRIENLSIPDHRSVAEGTVRGILAKMELTPSEFLSMARK